MLFARRSSRFCFSSSASRVASALVVPGACPASISAWLTQPRSVSGLIPSCSPARRRAPGLVAGSFHASIASRIARSRSSSGYFRSAGISRPPPRLDGVHQTRSLTHLTRSEATAGGGGQCVVQIGGSESSGRLLTGRRFGGPVGSFDEFAVDEGGAGADESDQVGCVHRAPAVLGRLHGLEGHGQPGRPRAGSAGELLPVPHGGERGLDRVGGP